MKVLLTTGIIVAIAAGLLALSASTAMAAPGDNYYFPENMQMDSDTLAAIQSMIDDGQLQVDEVVPGDGGDEDYYVPPTEDDEMDEGDEDVQVPDDGDEDVPDNPGNLDEDDTPDNPGDLDDDTPSNPETPVTPQTPTTSTSKLPNTGTQLVLIAGLGLIVALGALGIRRYVVKRAH